jgi:tripeptidyl-peptidase I
MVNAICFAATIIIVISELLTRVVCQPYQASSYKSGDDQEKKNFHDYFEDGMDGTKSSTHKFKESSPGLSSHPDITKHDRVLSTQIHDVMFVVQQRNMKELTRILHDISDPTSQNYGNHMTRQEIDDLISNLDSHQEVTEYLKAAGATVVIDTYPGECITARGPIGLWERMFNTEFHTYSAPVHGEKVIFNAHASDRRVFILAEHYSIPIGLDAHLASVLSVIQMPILKSPKLPTTFVAPFESLKDSRFTEQSLVIDGYITPQLISNVYNIDDNTGHPRATQAAFEAMGQIYCPEDLKTFQSFFNIRIQPVNQTYGNHTRNEAYCKVNGAICAESNLDIQYMSSIAETPTIEYYTTLFFGQFIQSQVYSKTVPPLVISISYGSEEKYVSAAEFDFFSNNAIKLSAMGVTIVAASGDDGAMAYGVRGNPDSCSYTAHYPASTPYVMAIGGTQVQLSNQTE